MLSFKIFIRAFILILIILAPFVHVAGEDNPFFVEPVLAIPEVLGGAISNALYAFYFVCIILLILGYIRIGRNDVYLYIGVIGANFVLFIASIANFQSVDRYVLLLLISIVVPCTIKYAFDKVSSKHIYFAAMGYIWISVCFVIFNFNPLLRSTGGLGNPNIFASTLIFSCIILLNFYKKKETNKLFALTFALSFVMVVLAGSRSAIICCALLLLLIWPKNIVFISFALIPFIGYFIEAFDVGNITERYVLTSFQDIASDSGRKQLWDATKKLIDDNYLIGNGTQDPEIIVGSNNIHNGYLRVFFMIGKPLGVIYFLFLAINLLILPVKYGLRSPLFLSFACFMIFNLGEDYFVGVGSAITFYFYLIIGLKLIFMKDN